MNIMNYENEFIIVKNYFKQYKEMRCNYSNSLIILCSILEALSIGSLIFSPNIS